MVSVRNTSSEAGIALVAVLWGVLLLSVLAAAFGTEARSEARLARNFFENAQARAAADAGVFWAVGELLKPPEARQIGSDGAAYEIVFAGTRLHVAVQDEAGKVDLNAAPPALVAAAMIAAGADPPTARRIADSVAEWRNSAVLRPSGRAERTRRDGRDVPHTPQGGGLFRLVEELRAVSGVTPALYEAVAPFLTVHSGMGGIDPSIAPVALLRALELDMPSAESLVKRPNGAVHMIEVTAATGSGARFTRQAVVQLPGQPQSPYRFHQWAEH